MAERVGEAAGVVLCGGGSTRMGRAKAWLPWGGEPLVAHAVRLLRGMFDEVLVVSSQELELPKLDARIVCDREPALGPLSGIREALAHVEAPRAFVCATDAPFLSELFVRALLARAGAVAARVDGHLQTLCAVYPRCGLARAEALIAAGRLRPSELLERLGAATPEASELPDVASVRGFNTPQAYLDAVRARFDAPTATLELLGRARAQLGRSELEVAVGTLGEVLAHVDGELSILDGDAVARRFLVSLDGREFVRRTEVPVGPGERVIVLDASVGG